MALERSRTFAGLLREYRRATGMTQEHLAEHAGLSVRALRKLESGASLAPRRDTLDLLAAALKLTPEERTLLEASASRQRFLPSVTASASTAPLPGTGGPRPMGNVPVPLTPIIGREHEEAAAVHLLRRDDVRLLTLTGAPGIGKTRLALQVARDLLEDTPDGVFLVELAPISDPALVLATIMRTLEVRETGGEVTAPLAALTVHLRARHLLLLLDNFEQIVTAAPQVAELLRACAGLKVLVTSRIPLHVQGEHRLAVPPLALPDLAALPPVQELVQYPAVALFLHRARAVKPTFALTPVQAPAVSAICHRLDGLPLAIELAAAWTRLLSPVALLARLEQRLPLLSAGSRDLPERQQTLRSAIDWSHDLLAPAEQMLLRRLAVFVGGCPLEAAEAVCSEAGQVEAVLPALATLVDTSLVNEQEGAVDGEIRFRLLELVREYALERLETSGEEEAVRERHARFYVGLAEQARHGLAGPEMEVWISRLSGENDNLRASIEWAKEHDIAAGLRMAVAILDYWNVRGQVTVGRTWLEELLDLDAHAGMVAPSLLRAYALNAAGILAYRQDDYALAASRHEEALSLARRMSQKRLSAHATNMLGNIARLQGDYERSHVLYQEALTLYQDLERQSDAATAAYKAGHLTNAELEVLWHEQGFVETVNDMGGAEIALANLMYRNKWNIAAELGNLARLAVIAGEYQRAGDMFERVRVVFAELGRTVNEAQARIDLGNVALHQGDYERVSALLEPVLPILRKEGLNESIAELLSLLGRAALGQGNSARAVALQRESLALRQETGDQAGIAMDLEGLGMAMFAAGQVEPAVRLLGKAAALREAIKAPLDPVDREAVDHLAADLRTVLGEETFAVIWAAARTTPLEQILVADDQ